MTTAENGPYTYTSDVISKSDILSGKKYIN